MARIDSVIERLFGEGGSQIVFETGASAVMHAKAGEVVVVRQKLTTSQIVGAFAEILPSHLRDRYPGEGELSFHYPCPAGSVTIHFTHADEKATVRVVPGEQPIEEPMELASPADMMDMAANAAGVGTPHAASMPPANVPRPGAPGVRTKTGDSMPAVVAAGGAPAPRTRTGDAIPAVGAGGAPAVRTRTGDAIPAVVAGGAPAPRTRTGDAMPVATAVAAKAGPVLPRPVADPGASFAALLSYMLARKASDLHISSTNPPMLRVDGDICQIEEYGILEPERLKAMLWSIAPERNRQQWEETKDTDFAHETSEARFRVNVFADRKGIGAVLRQIPTTIRTAEELALPKSILDLCFLTKGLVVVTGPTGSGKSTTLAAMIDFINRNREDHIITIEDPIEFVHQNKKCLVNQREVSVHTQSFKQALRAALREDPDIVLVGEMRDLETIAIAIETAETGHLVFGTLHTTTASSTVDRLIDQFPSDRQAQIRTMLSESLKGVVAQTLCKKVGGGRVAALEVLLGTGSVANLIREAKTFQLGSIMQTGKAAGMVTMNDALMEYVKKGQIEPLEAYMKSVGKSEIKGMLERGNFKFELPSGNSGGH